MATISILANTARPSNTHRLDVTAFVAGTFSGQDPVHSWKAGSGEAMTVKNLLVIHRFIRERIYLIHHVPYKIFSTDQNPLPYLENYFLPASVDGCYKC